MWQKERPNNVWFCIYFGCLEDGVPEAEAIATATSMSEGGKHPVKISYLHARDLPVDHPALSHLKKNCWNIRIRFLSNSNKCYDYLGGWVKEVRKKV